MKMCLSIAALMMATSAAFAFAKKPADCPVAPIPTQGASVESFIEQAKATTVPCPVIVVPPKHGKGA